MYNILCIMSYNTQLYIVLGRLGQAHSITKFQIEWKSELENLSTLSAEKFANKNE